MNKEEFCKILTEEANKIKCELNKEQQEKFYNYMKLLIEWNNKINLTAITDPKEIIIKHFIDSLTIVKYTKPEDQVVDIGTGAGFPGLPVKIAQAPIQVTLVDSLNKRINFLNEVIKEIEIKDIQAIHSRAEEFGKDKTYREKYNVAVSRAVARLNILVEYLLPTVKVGGTCICMKGPDAQEEIREAKNAIQLLGGELEKVEEFTLPDTDIKRTIITIKKTKNTPNKYPRKAGNPAKNPIK